MFDLVLDPEYRMDETVVISYLNYVTTACTRVGVACIFMRVVILLEKCIETFVLTLSKLTEFWVSGY